MNQAFDVSNGRVLTLFLIVLFRYVLLATIAFVVFYWIKRKTWSFRKIQLKFPARHDYLREIVFSVVTALIFTGVGWLVFMTPVRQYTQLYFKFSEHSAAYFVLSIVIIVLFHDTYFYWTHRLMHLPSVFKFFHQLHHRSVNPSPWAAMAFHPLEAIIEAGIIVVIAFLLPVHPFAIAIFLMLMMIYNVYGHLGYELYPRGFAKSRVGKWINTSVNHNQHHQYIKGNYGLYFLWWDRWMGTLRDDYIDRFEEVKSRRADAVNE